jgi:hypothetical protein
VVKDSTLAALSALGILITPEADIPEGFDAITEPVTDQSLLASMWSTLRTADVVAVLTTGGIQFWRKPLNGHVSANAGLGKGKPRGKNVGGRPKGAKNATVRG